MFFRFHSFTSTHWCARVYATVRVCVHLHVYVHMCACMYACAHACVHVCVHACTHRVLRNLITCQSLCPLLLSMQDCPVTAVLNLPDNLGRFLPGLHCAACLLVAPGPSASREARLLNFLPTSLCRCVQNMYLERGTEVLVCVSRRFCPLASSVGSPST